MNTDEKIDQLELAMSDYPVVECPLTHRFTPGIYTREILMPKGSLITSMIHKTEHPYFILQGKVSVFSDNDGEELIEAPFVGITKSGTRRVLYIHEDTVWITTHPCADGETIDQIEDRIIEKRDNNLLSEDIRKVFAQIHRYGIEEDSFLIE